MVARATVTGKNQIAIPAAVVRALGLEPGMKVEFELTGERAVIMRPVLTRVERVRQIEEKWQPLFPPGSDPIGDLIREREQDDAVNVRPQGSRSELARQAQGRWRHLLEPGEDPIAELINEREVEDKEIDDNPDFHSLSL